MIFLNSRAWLSASPCEWCPVALGGLWCFPSSGELFLQRQKAQSQKTAQLGTIRIKRSSASQKEKSKVRRSSSCFYSNVYTHTHTQRERLVCWNLSRRQCKLLSRVQLFATPWTSPWNSLGQNTGVCSLSLLQGIFPTQGSNPGLPHCRWMLYQLSHKGSPRILEWVAYSFCRGSSPPRNWNRGLLHCRRILYQLSFYSQ